MILITGATGHLGSKVMETLLKHLPSSEIAALVRDENKAADLKERGIKICIGDYDNTASLANAMEGITKVLLVSGGGGDNGLQQHKNVIDAAKNAGVNTLAYTSRCMKDRYSLANDLMKRHFETEDYILSSGLNYIFFRNILYIDAMVALLGKNVLESGMISLPAGQGKASYALRADQAEAIGIVLAKDDLMNHIYDFTNTGTYSFDEVAETLTELSGNTIVYTPTHPDDYVRSVTAAGTPKFVADMFAAFAIDIKNGQESTVSTDLEMILGRKPTSLKAGLKQLFAL